MRFRDPHNADTAADSGRKPRPTSTRVAQHSVSLAFSSQSRSPVGTLRGHERRAVWQLPHAVTRARVHVRIHDKGARKLRAVVDEHARERVCSGGVSPPGLQGRVGPACRDHEVDVREQSLRREVARSMRGAIPNIELRLRRHEADAVRRSVERAEEDARAELTQADLDRAIGAVRDVGVAVPARGSLHSAYIARDVPLSARAAHAGGASEDVAARRVVRLDIGRWWRPRPIAELLHIWRRAPSTLDGGVVRRILEAMHAGLAAPPSGTARTL